MPDGPAVRFLRPHGAEVRCCYQGVSAGVVDGHGRRIAVCLLVHGADPAGPLPAHHAQMGAPTALLVVGGRRYHLPTPERHLHRVLRAAVHVSRSASSGLVSGASRGSVVQVRFGSVCGR
jgi:hypothetical protein